MIIDSLTITNFRNYVGSNIMDFYVKKSKNIILIGGNNGAGKTTLAEAIKLCLYGRKIDVTPMSETRYQEYLSTVCSTLSDEKNFSISMRVIMDEENPPIVVDIERSFTKTEKGYDEELLLRRGDSVVDLVDESYWNYYVEKLIPPNVARYFFFDGERVRETISSVNSRKYLLGAIDDLTGITELENLKVDLAEVRKRIFSKTTQKTNIQKLNDLQSQLDFQVEQCAQLDNELEGHSALIKKYKEERNEIVDEMSRVSGVIETRKEKQSNKLKELQLSYDEICQEVGLFCYSRLIYKVSEKRVKSTVSRAKSENRSTINEYVVERLKTFRDESADKVPLAEANEVKGVIGAVIKALTEDNKQTVEKPILDLTLQRTSQLESMILGDEETSRFIDIFKAREELFTDISDLRTVLANFTDSDLDILKEKLSGVDEKIKTEEQEILNIEGIKNRFISSIDETRKSIRQEERLTMLEDIDRAVVENIDAVSNSIEARVQLIRERSRQQLTRRINEMYSILKNTKDMVKEVCVTEKNELELIDFNGHKININYISEGEKGILMYAVVYGLHELSNLKLPVIIDSPLGRMDSTHVRNLVMKLYPTVADQVIVLSHDREITADYHGLFKNSIAHEYTISKSGEKVKRGYFGVI